MMGVLGKRVRMQQDVIESQRLNIKYHREIKALMEANIAQRLVEINRWRRQADRYYYSTLILVLVAIGFATGWAVEHKWSAPTVVVPIPADSVTLPPTEIVVTPTVDLYEI